MPGDFTYVLDEPGPAWITWVAVVGGVAALVVGLLRRRPPFEAAAGLAAAAFLLPVVVAGFWSWEAETAGARTLPPALVEAVRASVPEQAIVYADEDTSYLLAAQAPVYVTVAPPAHVADTEENRPAERAADARRFLRTGDLAIPRSYGAGFLLVDLDRSRRPFELPEQYRDERYVLYELPAAP
jgi:hypothetical protein